MVCLLLSNLSYWQQKIENKTGVVASEQVVLVFRSVPKLPLQPDPDIGATAAQKALRLRNTIIGEIINSERIYVDRLKSLVRDYYEPIKLLHGRNNADRREIWVAKVRNKISSKMDADTS